MQDGSTTIYKMLKEGTIIVPNYQRAYSWDTPSDSSERKTQTDVFLRDLEEHLGSGTDTPYYFGHFIFENPKNDEFAIVDGQQRLTTIMMFLSSVFTRLKALRGLNEDENRKYRIIKDGSFYPFSTVSYDNKLFRDYVIDHMPVDKQGLDTASSRRIIEAYDYFVLQTSTMEVVHLIDLMNTILNAECTTHIVKGEAEAIQRFIFQNDRGKHPSNLEVIKAHFMYYVLLYAGNDKSYIIQDIQDRFSEVYRQLAKLEGYVDEDSVLQIALRVKYNTLRWIDSKEKIEKELSQKNMEGCNYIMDITRILEFTAISLSSFFKRDELISIDIHAIRILGSYTNLLPYIVKCYMYGLGLDTINQLCAAYLGIALRDSIISTKAVLSTRLNREYSQFTVDNTDITPIIKCFEYLRVAPSTDWWYSFWNNDQLRLHIQGELNHRIGKFILWNYENYLRAGGPEGLSKAGYRPMRYDEIISPELEHIAPQTPTSDHPENDGYDVYDEEFRNQYIDCIGNYLLLSKSHNCSIGNNSFEVKRQDYKYLSQQREIQEMTKGEHIWNREKIALRKERLIEFALEHF